MIPTVWFLEWPQEIRDQFFSSANKSGQLTISGLELTRILLQWLVLEQAAGTKTLKHNSVAIWCDNLPAVAWTYKFRASTSPIAAQILRALVVRLHKNQTALLSVEHISGIFNNMVDVASRKHNTDRKHFLTDFSARGLLDAVPVQRQSYIKNLFQTAQSAIDFGIVASTLNERTRFWSAWGRFLHFNFSGIDTNLSTLSQPERINVLVLFAQHVRLGGVSPGKREVRAQTVQVSLRAVAAKC
jgi:hypothetical protein